MPRKQPKKSSLKSVKADVTKTLTDVKANVTMVARKLNRLLNDNFGGDAVQKIIPYYRVSTKQQGQSGLGLEGQRSAVDAFVNQRGCEVLAEYSEIESGKRSDRPQLAKALAHARRSKATLIVAKLDRLARNVFFLSKLMESNVDFIAIDLGECNRLTVHLMSAIAENELKSISDRTKAALAATKARGTKLGSARPNHWKGHEQARQEGAEKGAKQSAKVRSAAAREAYTDLIPTIQGLQASGKSLRDIAESLNAEGHTTRRGKPWNAVQVMRVLDRASNN